MSNYKPASSDKYVELIPAYTWVEETDTEQKYYFSNNTPGTYLDVDGEQLNLFITDDFYKENSMASYKISKIDGIDYLSMRSENYIIKSIVVDEDSSTAKMNLVYPHNNVPVLYLGFKGKFDDSIFKS